MQHPEPVAHKAASMTEPSKTRKPDSVGCGILR